MNPLIGNSFANSTADNRDASPLPAADPHVGVAPAAGQTHAGSAKTTVSSDLARRISINQLTTLRNCLSSDLDEYRRHEIAAIGVHWRKLNYYGIRRSIRRIQQSRLAVSSLGWIGGFTGEHGHALPEVMCEAKRMIRVASQIRAGVVTVVTGPQAGHIRSHAFRIVADALKELTEFASIYDVRLAVQPMHSMFAKNWSFIHTLDDGLQLLDKVGNPRLQLSFGTYHLWEEPGLLQRIEEVAPRIGLVSLADWGEAPRHENDRLLPGEGRLPLNDVIQSLEQHGFSGWYELEVWSRDLWKLDHRDLMRRCVDARDRLSAQVCPC
ncbi:sugar phosphate isomerase/epimerase family protein [Planctomicrobium piriforme]|uniref:Sugar phosphate isomerase/epimerase n=1 Tax=Planctomicrobium piriforme TaxID=1576369 RepID=A0A1I3ENX8_9PLAN|nr:sugar phosphate isomerase/epimerase family protein [Planctomicrobium piriforme]SFI00598.1 Sugar phosphate isomerase/epimerase [Planctomicrobium piriforme]